MNDSKWLFSVKSGEELELLTKTIDRVLLTISDYPNYDENDFETIRFQVFEIWNNDDRHKKFSSIMENYFYKIFLEHIKRNPRKTPAPKNFWPYSYQFYLCNPVKVFDAVVKNANKEPDIEIKLLVAPDTNRGTLEVEKMPTSLLSIDELRLLTASENQYVIEAQLQNGKTFDDIVSISAKKSVNKRLLKEALPYINQQTRYLLLLRDTDKIAEEKMKYKRR